MGSTTALVSVIIPTFNRPQFLPAAIASVFRQSFTDWELLIADDGSDESTQAYLRALSHLPRVSITWLQHTGCPGGRTQRRPPSGERRIRRISGFRRPVGNSQAGTPTRKFARPKCVQVELYRVHQYQPTRRSAARRIPTSMDTLRRRDIRSYATGRSLDSNLERARRPPIADGLRRLRMEIRCALRKTTIFGCNWRFAAR